MEMGNTKERKGNRKRTIRGLDKALAKDGKNERIMVSTMSKY